MTLKVPGFIDGPSTDAQIARSILALLTGSSGGLAAAGGLTITQKGTPDMHVLIGGGTLAEGGAIVPGTFTTSQGPYACWNDASFELAIPASDATNPRIETIILRVYDNAVDSSGKTEAVFEAVKGTAKAGATLENLEGIAAFPKSSLLLGYVLVPAKATSIVTANILNKGTSFAGSATLLGAAVTPASVGPYGAFEARVSGTEYEPSATRPTQVIVQFKLLGGEAEKTKFGQMTVAISGGTGNIASVTATNNSVVTIFQSFSFICPAGAKWKATLTEGASELKSRYCPM